MMMIILLLGLGLENQAMSRFVNGVDHYVTTQPTTAPDVSGSNASRSSSSHSKHSSHHSQNQAVVGQPGNLQHSFTSDLVRPSIHQRQLLNVWRNVYTFSYILLFQSLM